MEKTISFGKVDYTGTGRRRYPVEVEIRLRDGEHGPVFTASASVWNHIHTDIVMGGQCLDYMDQLPELHDNPVFAEILDLWRKYHLNDMHAGTEEQEDAVKAWRAEHGGRYDYEQEREHLKSVGLYEVELDGVPYRYGTRWLYREIPAPDLDRIRALFSSDI